MSQHTVARPTLAARVVDAVSTPRGVWPVFVSFALLFVATATYWRTSTDIRGTFIPAWELGQHHTINSDGYEKSSYYFHLVDGHVRSDRFPGAILAAVPAYAVWGLFGGSDGPIIGPSAVTAAVKAALSVVFIHRALLRITAPGMALAGTVVFALGTATWSVSADAIWTHTSTQLGLCMALYGIAANRALWPFLGMALAAAARPHVAIVALTLAVGIFVHERRRLVPLALLAGGAFGWLIILVWTRITFGSATLLPGSYTGRGSDVAKTDAVASDNFTAQHGWLENIAGFLVSPEHGVFVLTPIVLVALFGLRRAWPTAPAWTKYAALGGILYSLVQLAGNYYAGGRSFYAYRLAIEGVTLLTPLAVLAVRPLLVKTYWRRIVFVALAYGFAIEAIGAIWYRPPYDAFRPWHYYRPVMLAQDVPWHGLAAIVGGVALAAAMAAFVRCDREGAYDLTTDRSGDDGAHAAPDAGPATDPGGVAVYRRGRRVSDRR